MPGVNDMGRTASGRRVLRMRFVLALMMTTAFLPATSIAQTQKKEKPTEWLISFDRAMTEARKQNRLVLAYFSGSDWDPWCQKLDEDVFETHLFRTWAAEHVILLRVDFPREKRISSTVSLQNEQLKTRFSVSKTPTVVVMDPWGQPLARIGYDELKKRKEEP